MKKSKFILMTILIISMLALIGCGGGKTETSSSQGESDSNSNSEKKSFTIRIGSGHTIEGGTWTDLTANYFIPEVNKRLEGTNYEINWVESYGGSVATLGENLDAVEQRILDMSMVIVPFKPSELLISNIGYNTPFGTPDPEITAEVALELLEKYPEFQGEFKKKNQKLLSFGVSESYELITNFPVNGVDDLKGRKIGGAGSNLVWLQAVGANPVQGGLSETYQNIQSGVYDGYIMYTRGTYGFKLHEQAPYHTEVGFGAIIVGVLTINLDTYNEFPEEVREIIDEVGRELTFEIAKSAKVETQENIKKMEAEGGTYTKLPDAEREKWINMMPNQPNEYAQRLNEAGLPGTEIMRDYLEGMEKRGYTFPKPYIID